MSTLSRGDLVWWHDDGRPADPGRQGIVDRIEPGPQQWVHVICAATVPTIKLAPIYVHPATATLPVPGCTLCRRQHAPAEAVGACEQPAFRC